jgi:hypothetical protein
LFQEFTSIRRGQCLADGHAAVREALARGLLDDVVCLLRLDLLRDHRRLVNVR